MFLLLGDGFRLALNPGLVGIHVTTARFIMVVRKPHFLLYCDASVSAGRSTATATSSRCKWRCVVDDLHEQRRVELADNEQDSTPERSALIAVVRGLEALEQPSQVTLVTSSPYVNKGLRYGLKEWSENNYQWEHFGSEKPIRNADLWRRVDQAMQFHSVECRLIENASSSLLVEPLEDATPTTPCDKNFRIDAAHVQSAPLPVIAPKLRRYHAIVSKALSKSWHGAMSTIVGILRIPEQTIYALESTVDWVWVGLQSCFHGRRSLFRAASRT